MLSFRVGARCGPLWRMNAWQDLARFIGRHTNGTEQFARVLAKVEASAELVRLGEDDRGRECLTTRAMLGTTVA